MSVLAELLNDIEKRPTMGDRVFERLMNTIDRFSPDAKPHHADAVCYGIILHSALSAAAMVSFRQQMIHKRFQRSWGKVTPAEARTNYLRACAEQYDLVHKALHDNGDI